jgi:hypothetical protein
MDLKRGSGRMILELLLEEASSERVVGYHVRDGVLVVSNSEARDRDMTVRTYSLRDLVAPRRDTLQVQDWESEEIRDRANQLASVIMDSIEPDEWRATGGGSGTAEWLDGILTVRARPDTHLQLKGLLAALRRVNPGGDTAMLPDRDAFSDESEKAHRALDEMLPTVRFYKTPLRDALRWIAMEYDAGMHVRWANIEECGVEPDRPVELRLDNVSVGETLRVLLREHSATFGIEEGVLLIGVGERSSPRPYVHLYAVGDITRGDAAKVGNLMFVITDTIEPDSWAVNGGLGSITCLNETLVVRNSGRVHADVRALLASIRKTRATSQTKEGPPAVALPTRRP